jgi:hypothetical protein
MNAAYCCDLRKDKLKPIMRPRGSGRLSKGVVNIQDNSRPHSEQPQAMLLINLGGKYCVAFLKVQIFPRVIFTYSNRLRRGRQLSTNEEATKAAQSRLRRQPNLLLESESCQKGEPNILQSKENVQKCEHGFSCSL